MCVHPTATHYAQGIRVTVGIVIARELRNYNQHLMALRYRYCAFQITLSVTAGAVHHKPDAPCDRIELTRAKYMDGERLALQAVDFQTTSARCLKHFASRSGINENGCIRSCRV
jgi:hypothetical protein